MDVIVRLIQEPVVYQQIAFVLAVVLILSGVVRAGLPFWQGGLCALLAIPGGYGGSALFNALLSTPEAPLGGLSSVGGVTGAIAVSMICLRLLRAETLRFADASLAGIAFGYATWRLSCFLQGCCFGIRTDLPWGVTFGRETAAFTYQLIRRMVTPGLSETLPVHPTHLYEAGLVLFVLRVATRLPVEPPGRRTAVFVSLCGAGRCVIELFRASDIPRIGLLHLNQIGGLMILTACLTLWVGLLRGPLNRA